MDKQIGGRYQEPSVIALEDRVRVLENRVTALAEVVRVLIDGLGERPAVESGQRPAAQAARHADDLLLIAEQRARGSGTGAGAAGI